MLYHLLSTPSVRRNPVRSNANNCRPSGSVHSKVRANIKESDEGFEVLLATPGISKDQIDINVSDQELTISATVENNTDGFVKREFDFSSFKRVFTLPQIANIEKISANMEHGILTISIPKKDELKPKTITIK